MHKKLLISLSTSLFLLFALSCNNDNRGFKEYYHPMGNNPVQVVPWLKEVKDDFIGREGRISLYEYGGKEYYTAQVLVETEKRPISPYTIYENNLDEKIVYFHTDDGLASEQDSIYIKFINGATLDKLLWSNEKRHVSYE